MKQTPKFLSTFLLLIVVFALSALSVAAQNDFNGNWKINREQGDQPADKIVRKKGAQTADADSLKSAEIIRQPLLKPFSPLTDSFKIIYSEPEFKIEPERKPQNQLLKFPSDQKSAMPVGQDGKPVKMSIPYAASHVFYTDGRVERRQLESGKTFETSARREESSIIITEELPFGGKAVQTFELSPDAKQLFVTVEIKNQDAEGKLSPVRFVYDRAND